MITIFTAVVVIITIIVIIVILEIITVIFLVVNLIVIGNPGMYRHHKGSPWRSYRG